MRYKFIQNKGKLLSYTFISYSYKKELTSLIFYIPSYLSASLLILYCMELIADLSSRLYFVFSIGEVN